MSASSKKKLRKEQNAALLTEKQRREQKEAKKVKAYSISFIAIMLAVVIVTAAVLAVTWVNRTGILDKKTIALTVDEHQINSVELAYYLGDSINYNYNQWYSQYGDNTALFLQFMGLDVSQPMDEQNYDDDTTWAQYFLEEAVERAKNDYALIDAAKAEGFTMSEEEDNEWRTSVQDLEFTALLSYGYSNFEDFLVANYGFGSTVESYEEYCYNSALATAYYNAHSESLEYDDAALRAHEEDKYDEYSSFTFASYYLTYSDYLTGGTQDEEGTTVYSEDEKAAARTAVKAAAEGLAKNKTVEALDKAIAALPINEDNESAASTKNEAVLYTSISTIMQSWLADEDRKEGDITVLANESTTTDDDGNETTVVNGYYVVRFESRNDNLMALANVRHLLVAFEGGTTDENTGTTTYSDEEKQTAKEEAEELLKTWKDGDATEESFIELVQEKTDDTASAEDGGLYEDITPEQGIYVEEFTNWAVDEARKAGDCEIIETTYGYHIMYYVGDSDINYRDYMIENELRTADMEEWYNGITEPVTATVGNTNRLNLDRIISNG